MRLCFALLMITAAVAAAEEPKVGAKDKEALQGLWQAVELEANGQKAPAEAVKGFQVQFKGDQIVFNPASENRKHAFSVDPTSKPKTMDLTAGDGPKKGQKLPCAIYKLEGDKLTICLDRERETGKRPTDFKTAPGDGFALLTLERVKDKKLADSPRRWPTRHCRDCSGGIMITNDQQLQTTRERIAWFQDQVAHLRRTEANPVNYRAATSGFLAEIDRMQLEVREYLNLHPTELVGAAQQLYGPGYRSASRSPLAWVREPEPASWLEGHALPENGPE